jgi:membrane protein implicated in regulation of membrane protease activity
MAISEIWLHRPAKRRTEWKGRSWSAFEARVAGRRWFRNTLPFAWMPVVAGAACSVPALLLTHGGTRWLALGAVWASVVWVQLVTFLLWSGAGSLVIGHLAESSTEDVLRRHRRNGWRVAQDATLGRGHEIDHVAIGPGGVIVIETKWRRDVRDDALSWAARQALQGTREVTTVLRPVLHDAPVIPVVVVWGPDSAEHLPRSIDGVRVVHGPDLSAWLDSFDADRLAPAEVLTAWEHLLDHVTARDLYERRARRAAARRARKAAELARSTGSKAA